MIKRLERFIDPILIAALLLSLMSVVAPEVSAQGGPQPPDPSVTEYSQCSNHLGTGYTDGDLGCRWINGNLQSNNSTLFEGDATVQRVFLTDIRGNFDHTIIFRYGTTRGTGKHAYDFLTDDTYSEGWVTAADFCDNAATNLSLDKRL